MRSTRRSRLAVFRMLDAYQKCCLLRCVRARPRRTSAYAKDAGQEPLQHVVPDLGITIQVAAIDVEREPAEVLSQVEALAAAIAADAFALGTDGLLAV